ncbi:MAG: PepSY domain-containing protein [Limisphaerales bacterium]
MKTKLLLCSALAAGLLAGGFAAHASAADKAQQAKLERKAKISRADAGKIALAKVPNGTIKEAELEKEHGKLIWSFDIATPGSKDISEVQVNAKTGEVVSVEKESPAAQEKEKKPQTKEKKHQLGGNSK